MRAHQAETGTKAATETRTVLQAQRARVVPPLPRVFGSLQQSVPCFEEVLDASPRRAAVYPTFESLRPLRLSASGDSGATGNGGGGVATEGADSTASTATGGPDGVRGAPLRVGVVFCGERLSRPTSPVNVVAGLYDYLAAVAPGSTILGFHDGPEGLLQGRCREITHEELRNSMNQGAGGRVLGYGTCSEGGFSADERRDEARLVMAICVREFLDGLVIVAGSRDLSWAAALAICFQEVGCRTSIIGVPHSKNLNMYVPNFMPITLGFDSARTMLGEIAGNICIDSFSSNKYWHFLRCGEDALTMEVALQTRCTFSVLTTWGQSDVVKERMSLMDTVTNLTEVIERRRAIGRFSGAVLLSRNLIETLPAMRQLKEELLEIVGDAEDVARSKPPTPQQVEGQLSQETRELFKRLPRVVRLSLLQKRDHEGMPLLPTGLEAERILGRFVQQSLKATMATTQTLAPRFHNMELMSNAYCPTSFDCAFGYVLGHTAAALVREGHTFYATACMRMHLPVPEWEPCAVPFTYLFPAEDAQDESEGVHVHSKHGNNAFEIPKTGWRLRSNLVQAYQHFREAWVKCNVFKSPGPLQYRDEGDGGPLSERSFTLLAEYLGLEELKRLIQPVVELPEPLAINLGGISMMRDVRVFENLSSLEQQRLRYTPKMPEYLRGAVVAEDENITPQVCEHNQALVDAFPHTHGRAVRIVPIRRRAGLEVPQFQFLPTPSRRTCVSQATPMPHGKGSKRALRVGVAFTSNQVPGFHNVLVGLFDYLAGLSPPAEVTGFLGGYVGLVNGFTVKVDKDMVDQYRNLGGQHMLCQLNDIENLRCKADLFAAMANIERLHLDGLILAGNLEAQVDTALIAEACEARKLRTRVVGVPISIDCDFPFVQQTVGYDTMCRTLTAYIGAIGSEAESSAKWIFFRMVGSEWSHIAVECTLRTHPQYVLLSAFNKEDVSLRDVVNALCDLIAARRAAGKNYGIVLIPSGYIGSIVEMRLLFQELKAIMKTESYATSWDSIPFIAAKLQKSTATIFDIMPRDVQYEVCFGGRERGKENISLTNLSSERLLLRFVEIEYERRQRLSIIDNSSFQGSCYSMMYQARSALPTDFDCDLAYTLGYGASLLVALGKSGQLVHASNLHRDVSEWRLHGIPLTCLLKLERDENHEEQVVAVPNHLLQQKGIVRPFKEMLPKPEERVTRCQGPVQYWGDSLNDASLRTTWHMYNMPKLDPTTLLHDIAGLCGELQSTMAMAKAESTLYAVNNLLSNAVSVLEAFTHSLSLADASPDQKHIRRGSIPTSPPLVAVPQATGPRDKKCNE
mmetsp:Transcript_86553/g.242403  ORF Transcript_86553/g.242403 Transcript_86553/m.242403 type:complete len:1312 (-) Transcript_86553:80-4015(-)